MVDSLTSAMAGLELRPATPDDRDFLLTVYRTTREDELALTDWTEPEKAMFVGMQFRAQDGHYREAYPDGQFLVVTLDDEPIGRLYLARHADELHIIDIALVPAHRARGIGSSLLSAVVAEADEAMLPVRLYVEPWNPAKRLYARFGFQTIEVRGFYELMERPSTGRVGQLKTAS